MERKQSTHLKRIFLKENFNEELSYHQHSLFKKNNFGPNYKFLCCVQELKFLYGTFYNESSQEFVAGQVVKSIFEPFVLKAESTSEN